MLMRQVWPLRPTFDSAFPDVDQVRREMLRLLDSVAGEAGGEVASGVFPPLNVTQDTDRFYVRAELPGVSTKELNVSAHRNRVTISGRREIQRESDRVSYHRRERAEGSFDRSLTLPTEVDADKVEAKYNNGILTLLLPKAEAAKPRQIAVRS